MEKDTLKDDLEDFDLCMEAEREQRKQSQADLEFGKLSKQWDEDAIAQRATEGRPCLTINRMIAFTNQVTNDARLNRATIAVKPVGGGADKQTADIQSDLIRNIETQSQATSVYDTAFDCAVNAGIGYFRVNVDYTDEDAWDQDIFLERISNPFSVYGDNEGKELTSIDWNKAFVTDFYSKAAFEARWGKDRKASSFDIGSGEYDSNWFKDKRIRVAERWIRNQVQVNLLRLSDGSLMFEDEWEKNQEFFLAQGLQVEGSRPTKTHKVKQRIITGTDILEESDWLGKYIPIIPMYGEEANVNGKRYFFSLINRAKDSQRLYNYQRTLAAELGALQPKAPWLGPVGMFSTDASKWATANRVSHPYLEYDPVQEAPGVAPQRIQFAGPASGAMQEAMLASDDIKAILGIHDASLGARSNETSGKAIMARQHEGDVSTFNFISNRNAAVEHGGRIILDLIPKLYTAERILRCVQEDGTTYTVPINQPVAPAQEIERMRAMAMGPQMPQMQQPGMQQGMQPQGPMPQQEPNQPQEGPPQYAPVPPELEQQLPPEMVQQLKAVTKIFDLTAGKYDVTVTAGPGFTTRREEAATQMMEFVRVFPQAAPLIGDLLAKNLDWPGAEQVAERLKAILPPQAAGQNPQLQQAEEAIGQLKQQVQQMGQQLQDKSMDYQIKGQELQIKGQELQLKAAELQKPEPQQAPDPLAAAELQIKAREAVVKEYSAETDRMQVLIAAGINPLTGALLAQTVVQAANTPIDGKPPEAPQAPEGMHQMPNGEMMQDDMMQPEGGAMMPPMGPVDAPPMDGMQP